jgi:hypothetical protein
MHCAWRIRATRDELVEDFGTLRDDRVALDLGLLSGLVMYGWILGHSAVVHPDPAERAWAREELGWWCREPAPGSSTSRPASSPAATPVWTRCWFRLMAGVCVPEVLAAATDELQLRSLTVLLI